MVDDVEPLGHVRLYAPRREQAHLLAMQPGKAGSPHLKRLEQVWAALCRSAAEQRADAVLREIKLIPDARQYGVPHGSIVDQRS